jgi:DNA (cytosine-5)-methyltransferase 1
MSGSVFSFFSGAGFLDLGFEHSDFDVVFVNEINADFLNGYIHSRKQLGIKSPRHGYHKDSIDFFLSEEGKKNLLGLVKSEKKLSQLVGFIGGPPCPDFSVGGKNKGKNGENGRLSKSYVDVIINNQPDWFVFENVKGLWRTKKHREFYESIKLELICAGYEITERLINSIEFGAPQDRERIIMFGILKKRKLNASDFAWEKHMSYPNKTAFEYPWPTQDLFGEKPKKPKVPEELTIHWWFKNNNVDKHKNSRDQFVPRAGLARFEVIKEGDDSRKSYKRLHRWRYSPTAAYGNNEVHLHPWLPRRISVAEALAIQSLPKEYSLPEDMSLTAKFKTIGNGVPYKFSLGLAKTIKDFLRG